MNTLTLFIDEFAASARLYRLGENETLDLDEDHPTMLFSSIIEVRQPWDGEVGTIENEILKPCLARVLDWEEEYSPSKLPWRPKASENTEAAEDSFLCDFKSMQEWIEVKLEAEKNLKAEKNLNSEKKFPDALLLYLLAMVQKAKREVGEDEVDRLCVFLPIANEPLVELIDNADICKLAEEKGPTATKEAEKVLALWAEAAIRVATVLKIGEVRTIEAHQAAKRAVKNLELTENDNSATALIHITPTTLSGLLTNYNASDTEGDKKINRKVSPVRIFLDWRKDCSPPSGFKKEKHYANFFLTQLRKNQGDDDHGGNEGFPIVEKNYYKTAFIEAVKNLQEKLKEECEGRWAQNGANDKTVIPYLLQNFGLNSISKFCIFGNLPVFPPLKMQLEKDVLPVLLKANQGNSPDGVKIANSQSPLSVIHHAAFLDAENLQAYQTIPSLEVSLYPEGGDNKNLQAITIAGNQEENGKLIRTFNVSVKVKNTADNKENLALPLKLEIDRYFSGIEADAKVEVNAYDEIFVSTFIDKSPIQPKIRPGEQHSGKFSLKYVKPGTVKVIIIKDETIANYQHEKTIRELKLLSVVKAFI